VIIVEVGNDLVCEVATRLSCTTERPKKIFKTWHKSVGVMKASTSTSIYLKLFVILIIVEFLIFLSHFSLVSKRRVVV